VFAANVLTSRFAWVVEVSRVPGVLAAWVGVAGTATFARVVPNPGTKAEEREGVKGAEVGTIREGGFGVGSSRNDC